MWHLSHEVSLTTEESSRSVHIAKAQMWVAEPYAAASCTSTRLLEKANWELLLATSKHRSVDKCFWPTGIVHFNISTVGF